MFRIVADPSLGREGRTQAEIGIEQFAGRWRFQAPRLGEFGVEVEQAQGLIGLATGEFVEVIADGRNAAPGQLDDLRRERALLAGQLAEQAVELLGQLGQPIQPDDGEGAVGLVQMGLGEFDPARAVRGGSGFGERIHCSLKGQVDLAFDPGQRTQVEFVC